MSHVKQQEKSLAFFTNSFSMLGHHSPAAWWLKQMQGEREGRWNTKRKLRTKRDRMERPIVENRKRVEKQMGRGEDR